MSLFSQSRHPERDSQMIYQSPEIQRTAVSKLFRIGMMKLVKTSLAGLFLALPSIVDGQSYTNPSPNSSVSPARNSITVGDRSYRVVSAEDYANSSVKKLPAPPAVKPTQTKNLAEPASQRLVATNSNEANASTTADCNACEPGDSSSMQAQLSKACNSCGTPGGAYGCLRCESYFYGVAEAIHVDRDNADTDTISSRYGLSGFEMEMGTRITVGRVPNCFRGWEGTFTGIVNWNSSGGLEAPIFLIQSNLEPIAPVSANDISAFNNATIQTANYDARYWSAELNRTYVGWEVAKMICGVRYIDFEEEYNVFSENDTESGSIYSDIDNKLLGLQVGVDLTYPVLRKAYIDFRGRAGVYANFLDLDLAVINDNEWAAGINDKTVEAAGQFELGIGLRYEVTPKLSLKCGAELWYLTGIGTAYDQLNNGIMGRNSVEGYDELVNAVFTYGADIRF